MATDIDHFRIITTTDLLLQQNKDTVPVEVLLLSIKPPPQTTFCHQQNLCLFHRLLGAAWMVVSIQLNEQS